MRITVKVKTRAKTEKVEQVGASSSYTVSVKALPVDGKANDAVIRILAKHFNLTKSQVVLVSGQSSRQKKFEIG